ncbi:hypothetical protein AXF42_Ash011490 [Apostasia shenzhenica]|uniref:Uncharacterized protein n=1 Tax=Apostasia shenzhenica TaxID=1088818 RepID=A0A2I0BAR0_9ASPA|nr:hypothetical protein AXF42_Ash011490 [Apostasia shenzhenica]
MIYDFAVLIKFGFCASEREREMEEGKKPPESSSAAMASFLSEVRLETSPTAIGFSDSCPCCGNKKRRCLLPATFFRKKVLVLDPADPQSNSDAVTSPPSSATPTAASLSLTPPPSAMARSHPDAAPVPSILSPASSPFHYLCSDPISPMSPLTPSTPSLADVAAAPAASPAACADEKAEVCAAAEDKKDEDEGTGGEEVRVCVRCRCGVVRRIALVR